MLFCKINKFVILAATALIALSGNAQSFKLPKAHNAEHQGLIAKQENIGNQISVEETKAFVDNLFKEEEEPELDIYTEGWESKRVNAYAGMEVPDTKVIDVSNFAMPTPGYSPLPMATVPGSNAYTKALTSSSRPATLSAPHLTGASGSPTLKEKDTVIM